MAVPGSLCWFDTLLTFRTESGAVETATPLDITRVDERHGPITGLVARHAFVEIGFRYLMRDVLQIALAPESVEGWAELLKVPPSPEQLQKAVRPYRSAFMLDHPLTPAMQVSPTQQRLAEMAQKPSRSRKAVEAAPEDDEEDRGCATPVAALLPDAPTANALKGGRDFFVKRDTVEMIGAGAVLPVLYADMILFPVDKGGYFGLPHGADSLKFWIAGRTLWESIAANLLTRDHPAMQAGAWPPPCDGSVFLWLDPDLPALSLKKGDPAARKTWQHVGERAPRQGNEGAARLHPAAIPMPRRYRLCAPSADRVCDLTGVSGPVFSHYERWPNGLQYAPVNWWAPFAAVIDHREWDGSAWAPRKPKPAKGEAPDAEAEAAGPQFLKAQGPLRFDQWLELSLDEPRPLPGKPRKEGQPFSRTLRPPVVAAFKAREAALNDALGRGSQRSDLARRLPFRLEAVAAAPDPGGKALGGFSRGSLALWSVRDTVAGSIADAVRGTLEATDRIAAALRSAAKDAAETPSTSSVLGRQLGGALRAALDTRLAETTQAMFQAFTDRPDADAARNEVTRLQAQVTSDAAREALRLFDAEFPFTTIDETAIRIAKARKGLAKVVGDVVRARTPAQAEPEARSGSKRKRAGAGTT